MLEKLVDCFGVLESFNGVYYIYCMDLWIKKRNEDKNESLIIKREIFDIKRFF